MNRLHFLMLASMRLDILLFILSTGAGIFYLLVYVDDILLTGNNLVLLKIDIVVEFRV